MPYACHSTALTCAGREPALVQILQDMCSQVAEHRELTAAGRVPLQVVDHHAAALRSASKKHGMKLSCGHRACEKAAPATNCCRTAACPRASSMLMSILKSRRLPDARDSYIPPRQCRYVHSRHACHPLVRPRLSYRAAFSATLTIGSRVTADINGKLAASTTLPARVDCRGLAGVGVHHSQGSMPIASSPPDDGGGVASRR